MMQATEVFAASKLGAAGSAPLYLQVKRLVMNALEAGALRPGDAVPSEREAADLLGVSRVTVRRAFTELVDDGVLTQKRGSGTFVQTPPLRIEQPLSRLTSFSDDMRLRGLKTEADWLDRSVGLPTPDEALKLSISPIDSVCRFRRLRRANGAPLAIENALVPQKYLKDINDVKASLYEALERQGHRPVRALQRLSAIALPLVDAKLLGLAEGSPALFIERIAYLPDGRTVEYTRSHYRGDSYDFVAELSLATDAKP